MEGVETGAVQKSFEGFIAELFTLVGSEEGVATEGVPYVRRIGYHKLEEEKGLEGYTYFFRHCWSTRVCVKLQIEGETKGPLVWIQRHGLAPVPSLLVVAGGAFA